MVAARYDREFPPVQILNLLKNAQIDDTSPEVFHISCELENGADDTFQMVLERIPVGDRHWLHHLDPRRLSNAEMVLTLHADGTIGFGRACLVDGLVGLKSASVVLSPCTSTSYPIGYLPTGRYRTFFTEEEFAKLVPNFPNDSVSGAKVLILLLGTTIASVCQNLLSPR